VSVVATTDRLSAALQAREWLDAGCVVLDTETTGVGKRDQVIEIAVLSADAEVLHNTLVRPTVPIHPGASQVNGIWMENVIDAPAFAGIYDALAACFKGRPVLAYNAPFDRGMINQSAEAWLLPPLLSAGQMRCAMRHYAHYAGLSKWVKLTQACRNEGIAFADAHRALEDARLTLLLLYKMAEGAGG
jgi:DNA polymerase III subunit epsilon